VGFERKRSHRHPGQWCARPPDACLLTHD
jgi:hypothetical protein